jgi:hypothetical protein
MIINECCKVVAKTIVDKMKSGNKVMVAIRHNPRDNNKEIRLYTPTGMACGSKSLTQSEYDDMFGKGITGMIEIDIDKLVRNQYE